MQILGRDFSLFFSSASRTSNRDRISIIGPRLPGIAAPIAVPISAASFFDLCIRRERSKHYQGILQTHWVLLGIHFSWPALETFFQGYMRILRNGFPRLSL